MPKNILLTSIITSLLLTSSPSCHGSSELLTNKNYFAKTHELIQQARESIDIYMYYIIADTKDEHSPVNILINDLIEAKKKNIKINIWLEGSKLDQNKIAYQKLTENGIKVTFDTPKSFLHAKTVTIDDKYSIIGSTNWSRSSIETNYETSILTDSPEIAASVKQYFSRISVIEKPVIITGVSVPAEFLLNPELGPGIFKDHSQKALDMYLSLLKDAQSCGKNTIVVSPYNTDKDYLKIRKPLRQLKYKYRLISYNTLRDKTITIIPVNSEKYFTIPYEYWDYGYSDRLSFKAKYIYLIALLETREKTSYPFWYKSNAGLSAAYHISANPISLGFLELEKENIIEITRSKAENKNYENRAANIYKLNPLTSAEEYNSRIKGLEEQYGRLKTRQAKYLASLFNDPKDIDKITRFINLIKTHGYPEVIKAAKRAANYKKGTSLNSPETVSILIKS